MLKYEGSDLLIGPNGAFRILSKDPLTFKEQKGRTRRVRF
jgi:hypothetical protein